MSLRSALVSLGGSISRKITLTEGFNFIFIFILGPETNATWKHAIAKQSVNVVTGGRISLTVRSIATMYKPVDPNNNSDVYEEEEQELIDTI